MNHEKTYKLTLAAVLTAILILMGFTPLGYLRVGVVSITFNMIPVVIGAMVLGPAGGALLGGVFGLTSFCQAFVGDFLGSALFAANPFFYAIMCFVPRILMGCACGWIFKGMQKVDKTGILSFGVTSLSGAVLNTVLFVSALILLFRNNATVLENVGDSVWSIITALVTFNALIEAAVCLVIGTAVAKALYHYLGRVQTR